MQEKRLYTNLMWTTRLNDLSKLIYERGLKYREWASASKRRQKELANRRRLFYFLYLSAARIGETMLDPLPTIRLSSLAGKHIVTVSRINEKHFEYSSGERRRSQVQEMLYVNGVHEKLMWEYVFPDEIIEEQDYKIDYFIEPLMNHKAFDTTDTQAFQTTRTRLSSYIHYFKADMTSGTGTLYKDHSFTPHQLRHLRVYALHFNWGYDWDLIQAWLGWSKAEMREHYVYINKQLKLEQQAKLLQAYAKSSSNQSLDTSEYGLNTIQHASKF
jgi:hypothetical protein